MRLRNLFLVIFFQAVTAAAHSLLSLPSRPVSTCSREYTGNQMWIRHFFPIKIPFTEISRIPSRNEQKKIIFFSRRFFISFSFLFFLFFLFHFSTHNVQNKSGRPGELQGKEVSVYYSLSFSCVISNIYFYFFSFLFQFYVLQCASM